MSKDSPSLFNSRLDSRRRFLSKTFVAGAFATLTPAGHPTIALGFQNDCKVYLSLADSLLTYIDLLAGIESNVSRALSDKASKAYQEFSNAYADLYRLTRKLEEQICKSATNIQARQICDLTKVGLASAQCLSDSNARNANLQTQALTVADITEQVGKMAKCLPNGEYKLRPEDTEILNQVLLKVEEVGLIKCKSDIAQCDIRAERKRFEGKTSLIRKSLHEAVASLIRLEQADTKPEIISAAGAALNSLEQASTDLQALRAEVYPQPIYENLDEELTLVPLDLLIIVVSGGIQVFKKISETGRLSHHLRATTVSALEEQTKKDFQPFIKPVQDALQNAGCQKPDCAVAEVCIKAIRYVPIGGDLPSFLDPLRVREAGDYFIRKAIKGTMELAYSLKHLICIGGNGYPREPDFELLAANLLPIRKQLG